MAKKKTPTARRVEQHAGHTVPEQGTRRFRSRGIDVEIRGLPSNAAELALDSVPPSAVELKLDGMPIEVEVIDGKFHSQRAHMFTAFDSMDALVDSLLANEGRTWTLHGHVCDERCAGQGHHHGGDHHGPGPGPGPGHVHTHGLRKPTPRRRPAKPGRGRGGKR